MIINIEGTDGVGKATQTKLLYEFLTKKGYKCLSLSFPNYSNPACQPVKMFLSGQFEKANLDAYQINSFFALDRLTTMCQQNLNDYDFVLLDRYTPSSMIHQSASIKTQAELDRFLKWVSVYEYKVLKLPAPDVVLFLDVPVEISSQLANQRNQLKDADSKQQDILESDFNHLKHAYENAKYIAKKFNWKTINCSTNGQIKSIEEIHNIILKTLNLDK